MIPKLAPFILLPLVAAMAHAQGMQEIGDFTPEQSGYSSANAVSADGNTVVGVATNDDGEDRAFIYKLTGPAIQDFQNLVKSLPKVGADKELAAAQQQNFMARVLDTQCGTAAGRYCFQMTGSFDHAGSDGDIGRRNQTQGIATLGYGVSDTLTVGANLSMVHSSWHHSAVNAKNGYGLSAWLKHSASGLAGTGLQVAAALGGSVQDTDVTRGIGLDHVQQIKGKSTLKGWGARLGVGFGMAHDNGWLITPEAALVYQDSKFSGYDEKHGDFRASYDKAHLKALVLDLGVKVTKDIGSHSALMLGVGLEQDLSVDRMRLKGTSEIPGAATFDTGSYLSRNETRPYVAAGYQYRVDANSEISTSLRVGRDAYSNNADMGVDVSYRIRF